MSGFKDEKALWQFQSRRLAGKWDRYELITPNGHPDVKGSYLSQVYYIENKVGQPDLKAMEQSQVDYIAWLQQCSQKVFVCFGSRIENSVLWFHLGTVYAPELIPVCAPPFWRQSSIRR